MRPSKRTIFDIFQVRYKSTSTAFCYLQDSKRTLKNYITHTYTKFSHFVFPQAHEIYHLKNNYFFCSGHYPVFYTIKLRISWALFLMYPMSKSRFIYSFIVDRSKSKSALIFTISRHFEILLFKVR